MDIFMMFEVAFLCLINIPRITIIVWTTFHGHIQYSYFLRKFTVIWRGLDFHGVRVTRKQSRSKSKYPQRWHEVSAIYAHLRIWFSHKLSYRTLLNLNQIILWLPSQFYSVQISCPLTMKHIIMGIHISAHALNKNSVYDS